MVYPSSEYRNILINEDGAISSGTYNYGNGQCVGTISGTKN